MKMRALKRITSLLLALVMVVALFPVLAASPLAATGYDRGYSGGMAGDGYIRTYGVDVSEHQGVGFNFQNIKNNGYTYVIIRCGVGDYGYGVRKDYRFEEFYKNAKAAGLNVGAYFYSYATNASQAYHEADCCLSYLAGKTFEYPIYFDFEDPSANSRNGNTAYSICRTFLDKIGNAGYIAGLYGYAGWLDPNYGAWVPTASICGGKYECWMANYYNNSPTNVKSANYPSTYGMYQYTSNNYVGGVGPLDTNVCYKDYPTIVKTYGFNGYSVTGTNANIPDGTYAIGASGNAAYTVDIRGQSKETFAQANLWQYGNYDSQKFVFQKNGTDTYTIRNVNSGMYLEIAYGGANGEYKVTQCGYTDADCQRWYVLKNSDGTYTLKNKGTGKYLDLANGSVANGTDIQTWTGNGSAAQKWYLTPVDTLLDGVYTVRSSVDANYGWDIAGNSSDDGANLQMWSSQHRFVLQHGTDGYYTIRALNSGKYLDVNNGGTANGTNILQWTGNSGNNQKWLVIPNADGTYSFVSKCNGKYIDMNGGGNPANGTNIQCWDGNGSAAQKWTLSRQSVLSNGTYFIGSISNPNYRLEISGRGTSDGNNLLLYSAHGATSQQFTFTKQSDGLYTITNVNSGRQLDVAGGGRTNGTNVQQWAGSGINQKWSVVPNPDGSYSFVAAVNNLYMDLNGNSLNNDTNIQCWANDGNTAKKWVLHQTTGAPADGIYQINYAPNGSFRADIYGGSVEDGATIHLWSAHGGESQKYQLKAVGDGYYTIMSMNSGKYFDVKGGVTECGTDLQQYSYNGSDAQKFLILKNLDGTYSLIAKCGGKAVDLANGTTENGTNIRLWDYAPVAGAQKWTFTAATHNHSYHSTVVQNTKTTDGYTLHTCGCGSSYKDNIVPADGVAPTVTDVRVTEVSGDGYRVTCKVSDNVGVTAVKFPTWTEKDGQDDLIWHVASVSNGEATFYVNVTDHKTEFGKYITHIYAYDAVGNATCVGTAANVPAKDATTTISGSLPSGVYSIGSSVNKNFVLDVCGPSYDNGTNIHMWTVHGGENQMWVITNLNNGYYNIRSLMTGKYLDAVGSGTAAGTNVDQWEGGSYDNQLWQLVVNDNGTYTFINKCNGLALDMSGGGAPANGTNVQLWTRNNSTAQQWYLTPQKLIADGTYKLGNIANSNMQIEVSNSSWVDGGNVQIWTSHEGYCQQWHITAGSDGLYTIMNAYSGLVMDAAGWGTDNGTNVHQWTYGGGLNQKWLAIRNTDGSYTFVNAYNGLALDMRGGGSPYNGQNIDCWQVNGSTAQKWILSSAE